jgi:LysM repeat protein
MKIMKVLGVVVGIHVFALILIFANPGCSATSKPSPAPVDIVAKADPTPSVSVNGVSPSVSGPTGDSSPVTAAPIAFNPDAPALASSGGVRFSPTRPGTAAESALLAPPVADVVPATTYVVKSGDSLWTIAKKNHLTYQELAAANNLKTTASLHEGQKLLIPSKVTPAPKTPATASAPAASSAAKAGDTTPKSSGEVVKHTVKSGETLGTIAKKYGVKMADLGAANNITDPQKIYAGMELVIPGWKGTAGKSATRSAGNSSAGSTAPAKAPVPEIKPLFTPPSSSTVAPAAGASAPGTGTVPVIKVDDTPAPAGRP